jgi:hypothetical protein
MKGKTAFTYFLFEAKQKIRKRKEKAEEKYEAKRKREVKNERKEKIRKRNEAKRKIPKRKEKPGVK